MNPTLRRERMLHLIRELKTVSLQDLTGLFAVSKMTLHRDLTILESGGLIRRFFGGVVASEADYTVTAPSALTDSEHCMACLVPVTPRLVYSVILTTGTRCYACCPHCGLAQQLSLGERVQSALATDFISGRPHLAHRSHFLYASTASPCCHPSILTFEEADQAKRFHAGFGGILGELEETLERLRQTLPATFPQNVMKRNQQ
jgi:hypothetical protein